MKQDINKLQPGEEDSKTDNPGQEQKERFESDTQKIVRKHLQDPDHQITDEEMAQIRVGMNPPRLDEPTRARLEGDDSVEDVEEKMLRNRNVEEDQNTRDDKITPWDIREG